VQRSATTRRKKHGRQSKKRGQEKGGQETKKNERDKLDLGAWMPDPQHVTYHIISKVPRSSKAIDVLGHSRFFLG
jgi:hypothetical protein